MNEVTRNTMAHLRLDRAHLRPSLRQGGRRVLAAPALGNAAKERTSSDLLGFARPFIPSSPWPPDTRLRVERISCWTSPEPPARNLERPKFILTSPTKLLGQM
jgi:hypothetical protein